MFTVTKGSFSLSFKEESVESRVERVVATRSLSGDTVVLFTMVGGADGCAAITAGAVIVLDTSAAVIEPIVLVRCAVYREVRPVNFDVRAFKDKIRKRVSEAGS